jgi:hypothetical protein
MRVLQQLRGSDPLAGVDVDALVQHPLFEELRNEIISSGNAGAAPGSTEVLPGPFGSPPRRPRRGQQLLAVAAVLIALAGILYVVLASGSSNDTTTTPFEAGRALGSGSTGSTSAARSGSWKLVSQLVVTGWQQDIGSGPPPGQLTCPSVSACYALSARYASAFADSPLVSESLYVSTDFGLSWSVLPLPSGFRPSARLSCPSEEDCAAPGVVKGQIVLIETTDGGHQWTVAPWKRRAGELVDLSCTSSTTCRAILEGPSRTLPSKTSASTDKILLPLLNSERSCATWTRCTTILDQIARSDPDRGLGGVGLGLATSESLVTTDNGGLSWTSAPLPGNESLNTLSCSSASNCLALGVEFNTASTAVVEKLSVAAVALNLVTENAFQVGNEMIGLPQYPLPPQFRAPVAAIPSAISQYEATIVDLHLPPRDSSEVAAILRDCQAEKEDLALNAVGKLPVDQWNNDGTALDTARQTLVEQVSLQPFVRRTTNGGASWTQRPLLVSDLGNSALTCSSASICATVGSPFTTPDVLVTTDGGKTWHVWKLAGDVPGPKLSGVACPTASTCWATGSDAIPRVVGNSHNGNSALIIGTTNGGRTWSPVSLAVPTNAPDYDGQSYLQVGPITCPRENACLALGVTAQGSPNAPVYRLLEAK